MIDQGIKTSKERNFYWDILTFGDIGIYLIEEFRSCISLKIHQDFYDFLLIIEKAYLIEKEWFYCEEASSNMLNSSWKLNKEQNSKHFKLFFQFLITEFKKNAKFDKDYDENRLI